MEDDNQGRKNSRLRRFLAIGILIILGVLIIWAIYAHKEPPKNDPIIYTTPKSAATDTVTDAPTAVPAPDPTPIPTPEGQVVITNGIVYNAMQNISDKINVLEKIDKETGEKSLILNIVPDEGSPLEQARQYMQIFLSIKNNCYDVLVDQQYTLIGCKFCPITDKNADCVLLLEEKDGYYAIEESVITQISMLANDPEYNDAIAQAIQEILDDNGY